MARDDPFDLQRFVDAQAAIHDDVVAELRAGRKRSHWMWFVFPQVAGLGSSAMAATYAIGSREEARAYLQHPVLGKRLLECIALLDRIEGRSLLDVLGSPDDLKFRSSMTLFALVAPEQPAFTEALRKWSAGVRDERTVALLDHSG